MSRNMSSLVTLCVAAFVTFYVSDARAAQNETYSAYAAQNQVTDAILSRDGTTFMTFATERGKPFLRGWRIAGSDATQIGRIEIKDLRMPTRSPRPFPYSDINKDFASFKKTFALSPDGNLIARVECLDIDKIAQCQRLSILDWKGKTVKDTKDKKKDGILLQYTGNVPGERSCGLEFSPNGERLYFCSDQKTYFHEYGTTMNGLMSRHGMAPTDFLDYVHDIDLSPLDPDEALDRALGRLPGRKYVFTNGSVRHAEAVLGRIGIAHHFADIFDIVAADYVPKPNPECYGRFVARTAIAPDRAAMFEDIAHNLAHPHALGMTTVLVRSPAERRADHSNEWDGVDADAAHVHHVTEDLAGFLAEVVERRSGDT